MKKTGYHPRFALAFFERDAHMSDLALRVLLNALVEIDMEYLRRYPSTPYLYTSGVYYKRVIESCQEDDDWADIETCLALGYLDCEDAVAWRVAELRVRWGIPATFGFRRYEQDGQWLYHVFVKLPPGWETDYSYRSSEGFNVEDPSRVLDTYGFFATGAQAA